MIFRNEINTIQERSAIKPAIPRWRNFGEVEGAPVLISEIVDSGTSVECVTTEIRRFCAGKVIVKQVLHRTKVG